MTQLEIITSTELSGKGMFSISPFRNSTSSMLFLNFATTRPSGCTVSSSSTMRRRASVPMAENLSAYFVSCSVFLRVSAVGIFR